MFAYLESEVGIFQMDIEVLSGRGEGGLWRAALHQGKGITVSLGLWLGGAGG